MNSMRPLLLTALLASVGAPGVAALDNILRSPASCEAGVAPCAFYCPEGARVTVEVTRGTESGSVVMGDATCGGANARCYTTYQVPYSTCSAYSPTRTTEAMTGTCSTGNAEARATCGSFTECGQLSDVVARIRCALDPEP